MSKKFREKILKGSGFSNRKFESEYGMKLLKMMGWSEDKGLGKKETGMKECIQIHRREDLLGLGADEGSKFQWNNNWWEHSYNAAVGNLNIDFSDNESTNTSSEDELRTKENMRLRKQKLNFHQKLNEVYESSSDEEEDEATLRELAKKSKKIAKAAPKEEKSGKDKLNKKQKKKNISDDSDDE